MNNARDPNAALDPRGRIDVVLQALATRADGLTGREAHRRLTQYGPNEITRRAEAGRWRAG